jgi:hypothetical protein
MTQGEIIFTKKKLQLLKAARDRAVAEGQDEFTFEGKVIFVGYAKYLIEYLETQLS